MTPTKTLALAALALGLATTASADLFGLSTAEPEARTMPQITGVPDAHWFWQPSGETVAAQVRHYSPNLDGLGFSNQSRCYGHSLLSTRWFQYLVKPLKNGTVSEITPDEFLDFWGGVMDRTINQSLTAGNIDNARLQRFSTYDDTSRTAVGRLVGYYHQYQTNQFDHGRELYDDASDFRSDVVGQIRDAQLPPTIYIRGDDSAHALAAYKVEAGVAQRNGASDDEEMDFQQAWKISIYDPNLPGNGDASTDGTYEDTVHFLVFEGSDEFVAMSEQMEGWYPSYPRQAANRPDGTWHLPSDRYGVHEDVEDDSGEIRSGFWHWWNEHESISDQEAREISGLDSAD